MERQIAFANGGQRLYGMLHLPKGKGPHPAVAFYHGFTGTKIEAHQLFVKAARALARHGVAALRFDFRGSGESQGEFVDMTLQGEVDDALAALDFLSARREIDPRRLGVLGLSLGGCIAACVSGRAEQVKALALWAPVARPTWLLEQATPQEQQGAEQGWLDLGGNVIGRAFWEGLWAVRPLEELSRFAGPVLVVHGTADEVVPPSHGQELYTVARGPKKLVWLEGADHVFSAAAWERQAIEAAVDWFVTHLQVQGGLG